MVDQSRFKSLIKGTSNLGAWLRGKTALRSVIALFAVIALSGFLASNAHSINAQQEDIVPQVIAIGDKIPVVVGEFDTEAFGSTRPSGIAYNTAIDAYAIVDSFAREVFIVDNDGVLQSQFDTSGYSTFPQGIAYDSAANQYAIADALAGKLFFVSTAGTLLAQCDLPFQGIMSGASGVSYNSLNGFYGVLDSTADEVFIVNSACAIQSQFDTRASGATDPQGITYRPDTDQYEVIDRSADQFFIFDASAGGLGTLVAKFDTNDKLNVAPLGLAYNPDDRVSAFSDDRWNQVFPVDHRGTLVNSFDTFSLGISNPSDLSLNTSTGNLLITDTTNDLVTTVTTAGAFVNSCDVAGIGADQVMGIAYLASTNQLALADRTDDEIYITSTSCALESTFDTANLDSAVPVGLGVDLISGELTLIDSIDAVIRWIDTSGTLKRHCSTTVLGFAGGAGGGPHDGLLTVQDMASISAAGNFAVVDINEGEVVVFDTMCFPVLYFPLPNFLNAVPSGIAVDNTAKRIFIVDAAFRKVYEMDVPRVFEPTSLSGTFVATGIATLNLRETGDGFVWGDGVMASPAPAQLFGSDVKSHTSGFDVSGTFDKSALTLTLTSDIGAGPRIFTGTVAADLTSFTVSGIMFTRP